MHHPPASRVVVQPSSSCHAGVALQPRASSSSYPAALPLRALSSSRLLPAARASPSHRAHRPPRRARRRPAVFFPPHGPPATALPGAGGETPKEVGDLISWGSSSRVKTFISLRTIVHGTIAHVQVYQLALPCIGDKTPTVAPKKVKSKTKGKPSRSGTPDSPAMCTRSKNKSPAMGTRSKRKLMD